MKHYKVGSIVIGTVTGRIGLVLHTVYSGGGKVSSCVLMPTGKELIRNEFLKPGDSDDD
jgi:hypothetical protein